jgi:uncharacterized protein (DUF1778 family)
MSLRIRAEEKAKLLLRTAKDVIEEADRVQLTERDSPRVLELLENPPEPNARLLAAAQALPERS